MSKDREAKAETSALEMKGPEHFSDLIAEQRVWNSGDKGALSQSSYVCHSFLSDSTKVCEFKAVFNCLF